MCAATPLVGRRDEIQAVLDALPHGPVSLIGPVGIGTSRLAAAVAEHYPGPVWFVPLKGVSTFRGTLHAVARAAGHRLGPLLSLRHLRERAGRDTLLVLDNPPSVEVVESILDELDVRMLMTGQRIGRLVRVGPLSMGESAELFRQLAPGAPERLVHVVANKLDGVPLAIEVAAAWSRLIPAETLAQRLAVSLSILDDAPQGDGLGRVMEAGWLELSPPEREVLMAASALGVRFSRDELETVLGPVYYDIDTVLARLTQRALVRDAWRGSLQVIATVRRVAERELKASGLEEAIRANRDDAVLDRAETFADAVWNSDDWTKALVQLEDVLPDAVHATQRSRWKRCRQPLAEAEGAPPADRPAQLILREARRRRIHGLLDPAPELPEQSGMDGFELAVERLAWAPLLDPRAAEDTFRRAWERLDQVRGRHRRLEEEVRTLLALLLLDRGHPDAALAELPEARTACGTLVLARAQHLSGELRQAQVSFDAAARLDPALADVAGAYSGLVHHEQGRLRAAERAFAAVSELGPLWQARRAAVLADLGHSSQARRVLPVGGSSVDGAIIELARAHLALADGKVTAASRAYQTLRRRTTHDAPGQVSSDVRASMRVLRAALSLVAAA